MRNLTNLEELWLSGNPLTSLPEEICSVLGNAVVPQELCAVKSPCCTQTKLALYSLQYDFSQSESARVLEDSMKAIKWVFLLVFIGAFSLAAVNDNALALSTKFDSYPVKSVDPGVNTLTVQAPSLACPASIGFGQTVQCSIDTPGSLASITFEASAGDRVRVRMLDTSDSDLHPAIWVYRPAGTQVCFTLGNPVADLDCALDATGTFTILAGDYYEENTGTFNLFIERLNNPGVPTPIAFGQTLSDTVATAPELPAFTFEAVAGDRVRVRMLDTIGTEFHPAIWVYRPNGTQVCFTLGNPVADLDCALDATGTFTILAGSYYGEYPGTFSIFVQRLDNPADLHPIDFGQTLSDAVATAPELPVFTFEAVAGDHVRVRMLDTSNTEFHPAIWVYRPNGTQVCFTLGNPVADLDCALDATGAYTILAGSYYGEHPGTLNLFIQRLDNPADLNPIAFGQTLSDTVATAPELPVFTFEAVRR